MYVRKRGEYRSNPLPSYKHPTCIVTLSNSQEYVLTHSDKHIHRLQIFFFKDFHCKAQLFVLTTFHFYIQLFCSMGRVSRPAIYLYYITSTYGVSMESMMSTKSRISVPLLARIQWVRLPVACKVFCKHMSTYFRVQYRIPCISMQRSYVLVGNVLQKQL